MIFALLTEGMNAQQREATREQLEQPLQADLINKKLAEWKRVKFGA